MLQRATRNEKGNVATIKDEAGHEARHKMKLGATLTHGVPLYGYDRAVFAKTPMDLMRAAIMQDTDQEHAPGEYVGQSPGHSKFSEITAQFRLAVDNVTTQQEKIEVFVKYVMDLRSSADAGDDWAEAWATQDGDHGCGGNSPGQACEIQVIDNARGMSDGLCVSKSAGNMCWAFLNKEHAPEEYVGQPEQTRKKKKKQQKKFQKKSLKKKKRTNQKNKKKQRNSKRNKGM